MEMIVQQCESGRWIGWPKDRDDIIASGDTSEECYANVKECYQAVIEYEANQSADVINTGSTPTCK